MSRRSLRDAGAAPKRDKTTRPAWWYKKPTKAQISYLCMLGVSWFPETRGGCSRLIENLQECWDFYPFVDYDDSIMFDW